MCFYEQSGKCAVQERKKEIIIINVLKMYILVCGASLSIGTKYLQDTEVKKKKNIKSQLENSHFHLGRPQQGNVNDEDDLSTDSFVLLQSRVLCMVLTAA